MNEYIDLNNGHTILRITGNKNNGDILVSTEVNQYYFNIKSKRKFNDYRKA